MLSSHKLEHLLKIEHLECDAIMLNLEDGVSVEQKPFALLLCAIFLSLHKECSKKLMVRVNELENGGYDEIAFLNAFLPDAIRVPKIKTPQEAMRVRELLDENIELHLSIETKEAWQNLASFSKYADVFYLGIYDLSAELNLTRSIIKPDNKTLHYILTHFLLTSKVVGVKPVAFVYQEHKNVEIFENFLELLKEMGYDAMSAISPTQAKMIMTFFATKTKDIEDAKEIVRLFELNVKNGISGFDTKEYGFIDEPIYKNALNILKDFE